MKKANILELLFVSLVIISCTKRKESNENMSYEALKAMKISEMSIENQQLVKNRLIDILKDDEDFAIYSKSFQYIVMARLDRLKNGNNKPMGLAPQDFNEKIAFYERNGIKKPKDMVVNEINMILAVGKLTKKYPELKNLDAMALNEVLKQATTKWNPNLGAQLGGVIKSGKVK